MDSKTSVLRSAKSFFAGTLLSRVFGMVRDIAMAFCFGSAPEVAAFMVAYRMANLFRRLLGEGNLQGGFVPQFERLRAEGEEGAVLFFRDVFYSMVLSLSLLAAAGCGICYGLSHLFESDIPLMTCAIMPGVLFLCLYALNGAVLQCQRRYFLSAFAPVAFNIVWIAAAFFLRKTELRGAMFGLSFAVAIAFAFQYAMTLGPVLKWAWSFDGFRKAWHRPQFFSKEVRALLKPLSFGIVGIGAAQINSAMDAIFARLADPSGPAYLWYAIRIQQLPLALFGIALAGALLPPLARAMQAGAVERYRELLQGSLRQSAFLMVPCAVGMVVLSSAGLDLLYGHGGFSESDVFETGRCLRGYAFGLIPMVFVLLLANGFYARKEYIRPMRCSLIAVGCNAVLNALFVFGLHWGAESIAIATSISSVFNCALLAYELQKEIGSLSLWQGMGRIGVCSLVAALLCWGADGLWTHQRALSSQLGRFIATGGVYGASVLILAYLMNVRELFEFVKLRKAPQ